MANQQVGAAAATGHCARMCVWSCACDLCQCVRVLARYRALSLCARAHSTRATHSRPEASQRRRYEDVPPRSRSHVYAPVGLHQGERHPAARRTAKEWDAPCPGAWGRACAHHSPGRIAHHHSPHASEHCPRSLRRSPRLPPLVSMDARSDGCGPHAQSGLSASRPPPCIYSPSHATPDRPLRLTPPLSSPRLGGSSPLPATTPAPRVTASHPSLQVHAARAVGNLCTLNREGRDQITKAGGVKKLLILVCADRPLPLSSHTQTPPMHALLPHTPPPYSSTLPPAPSMHASHAARSSYVPLTPVVSCGARRPAQLGSGKAQEYAARAVARLAHQGASVQAEVCKGGGIALLLALLSSISFDAQTQAASALAELAQGAHGRNRRRTQDAIAKAGGIGPLLQLLESRYQPAIAEGVNALAQVRGTLRTCSAPHTLYTFVPRVARVPRATLRATHAPRARDRACCCAATVTPWLPSQKQCHHAVVCPPFAPHRATHTRSPHAVAGRAQQPRQSGRHRRHGRHQTFSGTVAAFGGRRWRRQHGRASCASSQRTAHEGPSECCAGTQLHLPRKYRQPDRRVRVRRPTEARHAAEGAT